MHHLSLCLTRETKGRVHSCTFSAKLRTRNRKLWWRFCAHCPGRYSGMYSGKILSFSVFFLRNTALELNCFTIFKFWKIQNKNQHFLNTLEILWGNLKIQSQWNVDLINLVWSDRGMCSRLGFLAETGFKSRIIDTAYWIRESQKTYCSKVTITKRSESEIQVDRHKFLRQVEVRIRKRFIHCALGWWWASKWKLISARFVRALAA